MSWSSIWIRNFYQDIFLAFENTKYFSAMYPSSLTQWCTEGGGFEGFKHPLPQIPKFWQSWAEFPVPWKIHLLQPNMNMGFTHLQIERNPHSIWPLSSTEFVETPPPPKKNSWVYNWLNMVCKIWMMMLQTYLLLVWVRLTFIMFNALELYHTTV
jgi:hypothetical protein